MVEVDPVSSSSSTMAIDLNLNLNFGPSFVLELALGRGQGGFHGSFASVSRQSWPRFEPRMLDGGQEHEQEQEMSEDHISSNFGRRDLHNLDNDIRALQLPGVDMNINADATRASQQTNVIRDINDDDNGFRASRQIGVNDDIDDDNDDSIGASRQTSVYADIEGDDAIRALRRRDVGVNIFEDEGIRALRQRDVNVNINDNSIGTSQQTNLNADIDNDDGVRVAPETGVNMDTNHNGNRVARQTDVNTNINDSDDGIRHSERSSRHTHYPRRPRQALFAAVREMVETRETSAGHVSPDENRVLITIPSATISTPFPIISRVRTPRTQNPSLYRHNNNEDNKIHGSYGGAHFECNICLEMAVDPVVSCCGHLFCWSCIYQWLHFHSSQKECPVCKGFLSDDVLTPIYGRGTSEASDRPHGNTPPRPHAHRINDKMQFPETFVHERLIHINNDNVIRERSNEINSIARQDSSQAEGNEAEASRSAELILNRLRIAQRLQREHLDERLRLRWRQRMMGRRGSVFRSFAALEAVAAQVLTSSEDHIQMQHPTMEENVENIIERSRDQDGGSGLPIPYSSSSNERLSFSHGIESDLSANVDNDQLHSVVLSSQLVTPQLVIPSDLVSPSAHLTTSSHSVTSLNLGTSPHTVTLESNQLPIRSLATSIESEDAPIGHSSTGDLQQSWRVWHNSASGSFDVEAECFHARKRQRLN